MIELATITRIMQEKNAELRARYQAQRERIENAYSEANSNKAPVRDHCGRLHAPCDGYAHWDTGEIYGAGQFLYEPIEDEWYEKKAAGVRYRTKFTIRVSDIEAFRSMLGGYGIDTGTGKHYPRDGEMCCTIYLASGYKPFIAAIEEAIAGIVAREREELRSKKGVAPEGKTTVEGTVVSLRGEQFNKYSAITIKMTIVLENGATAYGTCPRDCEDGIEVGKKIRVSASFERSKNDDTHAYFKRPVAEII